MSEMYETQLPLEGGQLPLRGRQPEGKYQRKPWFTRSSKARVLIHPLIVCLLQESKQVRATMLHKDNQVIGGGGLKVTRIPVGQDGHSTDHRCYDNSDSTAVQGRATHAVLGVGGGSAYRRESDICKRADSGLCLTPVQNEDAFESSLDVT